MDMQQLKYFKAVATLGKISDAAESLFISAPALSTSIARLEKELGVQLFDRAGNRITLNAQGEIFLKHAHHILSEMEDAKRAIRQSMVQHAPCISLISTNTLMWSNMISAFTSEFPAYTMACSGTSISHLSEEGFPTQHTFLLAYENEVPPAFNTELNSSFLFHTNPVVMLHKDHPLANEKTIDMAMLKNEKLLLTYPHFALSTRITQLLELHNIPFPGDSFYSYHARLKMVCENLGVSFATQCDSLISTPNVRYIPLVDPFGPWAAYLYWRKEHTLTEYEEKFRTFTEKFCRDFH